MISGGPGGNAPDTSRVLRHSEYWSVLETATGRKIADCGDEGDAWLMVAFDPGNRTVTKNRLLTGPVVDVAVQRVLPTSAVVPAPAESGSVPVANPRVLPQGTLALPADGREPVIV